MTVPPKEKALRSCGNQSQLACRLGYVIGADTCRTTSSTGPPWQSVVRRIAKDLNTGEVLEDLVVHPSEQPFYYAAIWQNNIAQWSL